MTSQHKRVVLSLAGLAVFIFLAAGSLPTKNSNTTSTNSNSSSRNAGTTTYSNSSGSFTGKLEDNYVDFSFDYPSSWNRDAEAGKGSSPNFVKVEKMSDDKVTVENFAVGYFTGQRELMPRLAKQLSDQLAPGFPEYKKVSEGSTTIGPYDGYEFRFSSHSEKTARGDLEIWGRAVLLPGSGDRKGAILLMIATSASDEVKSLSDVGDKGDLPIILNSFKFKGD